jgi:hypothetical protein
MIIGGLVAMLLLMSACSPVPDGVTMWVDSPELVNLGEQFTISVHVINDSSKHLAFRAVDVGDSYLSGVSIERIEPPFSAFDHVEFVDSWMTYMFKIDVPPGDHLVVTLYVVATRPGVQQGKFNICVNAVINCEFQSITTRVQENP